MTRPAGLPPMVLSKNTLGLDLCERGARMMGGFGVIVQVHRYSLGYTDRPIHSLAHKKNVVKMFQYFFPLLLQAQKELLFCSIMDSLSGEEVQVATAHGQYLLQQRQQQPPMSIGKEEGQCEQVKGRAGGKI